MLNNHVGPNISFSLCDVTDLISHLGLGISAQWVKLGAIQVLRNADGGGGGVSNFPEKSVTKV